MWRTRSTWIVLALLAAAGVALAARNMDRAFPLVALDLQLDRSGALAAARSLAESHDWGTAGHRQAAVFRHHAGELQRYVEAEAGGADAWIGLIETGAFRPYLWSVRQYREGEVLEARIRFAPDGSPWGFTLRLPEDEPGASLSPEEARALAERAAVADWRVELSAYELVESSQEVRPGGRTDHSFVYERSDLEYGEARFRLRLGVAGDGLSEVTRFAEAPEAFLRRHAELRSANDLIALIAGLASGILYLGLGAGVGLILLLRARAVLWRPALAWGAGVAALLFVAILNQLPLAWIDYDTAVPAGGFLTSQVLGAAVSFLGALLFLALVLMAGEGLARQAFPGQLQFWRVWSRGVAESRPVLGATLGGYLFAAFFIAYAVGFYLFATRVLGWSMSAEVLIQPDLLATPVPWVSAVGISLLAALSEEAMFRAVPLAGAAVLAARFGRRGAWLAGALVVQALIFAAAHANYPQDPAYARVVELFLPSLALGWVFLRFGLLTVVVAHYVYNLAWFSLPLFATAAPGSWLDKGVLVVAGLVPLGVVLGARWRRGARDEAPAEAYNGAWRPAAAAEPAPDAAGPEVRIRPAAEGATEPEPRGRVGAGWEAAAGTAPVEPAGAGAAGAPAGAGAERAPEAGPGAAGWPGRRAGDGEAAAAFDAPVPAPWAARAVRAAPGVGAVGLVLWFAATSFRTDAPPLAVGAAEAVSAARAALAARDEPLAAMLAGGDPEWRTLPAVSAPLGRPHRFVWQTAGPAGYRSLLGTYLPPPHWVVRFARFEGPVEDRAEEYRVVVGPDGGVLRVQHRWPEGRPAEALEEEDARARAAAAVEEALALSPGALRDVSAEAQRRPARLDWTFTFAAPADVRLDDGETRVEVRLAGASVVDVRRLVHVPEPWEREDRRRQQREAIIGIASLAVLGLLLVGAVVVGAMRLSRRTLPARLFAGAGTVLIALLAFQAANRWLSMVAAFDTALPYTHQVFAAATGIVLVAVFGGGVLALLVALGHAWAPPGEPAGEARSPGGATGVGLAFGAGAAGIAAVVAAARPRRAPVWPSYDGADTLLPAFAAAVAPLVLYVAFAAAVLVAAGGLARLRTRPPRPWLRPEPAALVLALVPAGLLAGPSVTTWLAATAVLAAVALGLAALVRALGASLVPVAAAVPVALAQVVVAVQAPFPGARAGAVLAAAGIMAAAFVWSRALEEGRGRVVEG